jgi:hypothetical protein
MLSAAPNAFAQAEATPAPNGGATASATVGLGLGGNVLVGGMDGSIALQPLSVEGTIGLDVAAGIAMIDLKFDSVAGIKK